MKANNNKLNCNYVALVGLTTFDGLHLEDNGYDDDPDSFYYWI